VELTSTATVQDGEVTDLGDVKIGAGSTIRGRVLRSPGDEPVPNVKIQLVEQVPNGRSRETATGEDGAFAFTGLVNGSYALRAPECFLNRWLDLGENETRELNFRIGATGMTGTVYRGGRPYSTWLYFVRPGENLNRTVQSGADGHYEVSDLEEGSWSVVGNLDGTSVVQRTFRLTAGETVEADFHFPSARLTGRVIDGAGEGAGGASVRAQQKEGTSTESGFNEKRGDYTVETDGAGDFVIENMQGGTYTLTASRDDLGMTIVEGIPIGESEEAGPITLTIDETSGGTVVSTALDMEGDPVQPAWCYLTDASGSRMPYAAQRNADGVMTIHGVPAGTYEMEVSSWGYSVNRRQIEVVEGVTATYTDVLYEAGALRWTVQGRDGTALAGVPCSLVPNDPTSIETVRDGETDSNGEWVVRGLYPGAYTATATLPGGTALEQTVTIVAHELTRETARAE